MGRIERILKVKVKVIENSLKFGYINTCVSVSLSVQLVICYLVEGFQ